MNEPLVTIGLPTYNNSKTIQASIQSILNQNYQNWELFIIIDGSTDGSYDLIKRFVDPRITILNDKENKGLIFRLNQIIDLAHGQYICRMDADDMMLPEKLTEQINYLAQNSEVDVLDTGTYSIDENDTPIGVRGISDLNNVSFKKTLKRSLLIHPTVMGKAEWFKNNRYAIGFERAEDFELWCRTFTSSVFGRLTKPLYIYREGRVNIRNYILTMRSVRKVLFLYGYLGLSKAEIRIEILKTYAKTCLYRLFGFLNIQNILTDKRNTNISKEEIKFLTQYIHLLKRTSLKQDGKSEY
ncbi:MAG TPA: glycosyltransferase [Mucilaginibacter sp.]|jgi:glycosyltransferase involved in cell wall biosynthesis|nr:glycosyltransferase [Mucilaginibacter sp.]